jgi:hypothetical protein
MCSEHNCNKCRNNKPFIKSVIDAGIPIVILTCALEGIPCDERKSYFKQPHSEESQTYYNRFLHENTVLFGTTPNINTIEIPSGMYIQGPSDIDPDQYLVVGVKYTKN